MIDYPTNYAGMSRHRFLQQTPDTDTAVVFIHGNVVQDMDDPDTYTKGLLHLAKYRSSLAIEIDDITQSEVTPEDQNKYQFVGFSLEKALTIDQFLQRNADKRVIVTCSAGVSRTGAVMWYLDFLNKQDYKWQYTKYASDPFPLPSTDLYFPNRDMYVMFNELIDLKLFYHRRHDVQWGEKLPVLNVHNVPDYFKFIYLGLYGDKISGVFSGVPYSQFNEKNRARYEELLTELENVNILK